MKLPLILATGKRGEVFYKDAIEWGVNIKGWDVAWTPNADRVGCLAAFEQALRFDPNDARAYTNKGYALVGLQRDEEALAAYDQVIRLDPSDVRAYTGKEELLRMLGHEGGL